MGNNKSRCFNLLLYPLEDVTHKNALEKISHSYKYAYIIHDKDVDEDTGEIKKSHVHCVLQFSNARSIDGLAKEINIESNYIEKTNDLDNSLLYLIHYNDIDKHQYSIDEVEGNLKNKLQSAIFKTKRVDENSSIASMIDFMDSCKNFITYRDFTMWCISNGIWSDYRRAGNIINKLIEEHNRNIDSYCDTNRSDDHD